MGTLNQPIPSEGGSISADGGVKRENSNVDLPLALSRFLNEQREGGNFTEALGGAEQGFESEVWNARRLRRVVRRSAGLPAYLREDVMVAAHQGQNWKSARRREARDHA